jgi:hypothetical protein
LLGLNSSSTREEDRIRGFTVLAKRARISSLTGQVYQVPIDGVVRNGPTDPERRLASHVHLGLREVDPAALSLELDRVGIAAASGAACGSGAAKPSHVLEATGTPDTPLRLSLGWTTTSTEVEQAIDVLRDVIPRIRSAAAGPTAPASTPIPTTPSAATPSAATSSAATPEVTAPPSAQADG